MRKSLLSKAARKPQNQFTEMVQEKIKKAVVEFLIDLEVPDYHAGLLAEWSLKKAIADKIKDTADTAPDVIVNDGDKIERMTTECKKILVRLDENGELDRILEELVIQDSQGEGNSI